MIKMKINDPKIQNFHRDPRRSDKPFRTNNPKYSFYHLIERKPVKICFIGCKMPFTDKKWTYLVNFLKGYLLIVSSKLFRNCNFGLLPLQIFFFWCKKLPNKFSNNKVMSCKSKTKLKTK
jgi:hypothetical protein